MLEMVCWLGQEGDPTVIILLSEEYMSGIPLLLMRHHRNNHLQKRPWENEMVKGFIWMVLHFSGSKVPSEEGAAGGSAEPKARPVSSFRSMFLPDPVQHQLIKAC